MRRRQFMMLVGGSAAAWPLAARAQQGERMRRIGILASQPLPPLERFARKLGEYGYIEGQNLRFVLYLVSWKVVTTATSPWPRNWPRSKLT
jgi:putative ABC transport system substrate-binding protein